MRWPFGLFEQKSNPASRVIMLGLNVSGPVAHKDFRTLATQSFERNATVYGCVSTIAQACATVPWVLYEFGKTKSSVKRRQQSAATYRKGMVRAEDSVKFPFLRKAMEQTEVTEHPVLRLLERPNPSQSQTAYVEQLLSYLLISGNAYEHALAPESGPRQGQPMELWNHRPDRMEILASKDSENIIAGYRYKVGSNTSEPWAPESMIHHKFFNPTDDFYGMSPLMAATRAWQTENLGADWNYSLLNNGTRTSGALVIPTTLGDDAFERLKGEITASYVGAGNAGRPMTLEGGVKWEPMGLSPMEMDFLAGMRDAAIRICRVYHLAPEIIGVPDAKTYNSLAEARKAMWQEAALPLLDRLRDSYNQRIVPAFGDRIFLDYDRDQIDAIQEDRAKVFDMYNRVRFLSTNDKRIGTGFETYDDPIADIPESILNPTPGATGEPGFPAGTVTSLRSIEEMLSDEGTEFVDILRKTVEDGPWTPEQKASALAVLDTKAQKLTAKQKKIEAALRKAMGRHFKDQGADLANYLRREIAKL